MSRIVTPVSDRYRLVTDACICFHRLPCIITIQQTEAWTGPLGKRYDLWFQQTQVVQPEGFLCDPKPADVAESQILTFTLSATEKIERCTERVFVFWYRSVNLAFVWQGLTVYIQNKPCRILGLPANVPQLLPQQQQSVVQPRCLPFPRACCLIHSRPLSFPYLCAQLLVPKTQSKKNLMHLFQIMHQANDTAVLYKTVKQSGEEEIHLFSCEISCEVSQTSTSPLYMFWCICSGIV